jgi:UDP-N-acetylmuramate dehydrogenase
MMRFSEVTTIRVGGSAARVIEASDPDVLIAAARECWSSGDDWFVLGGGSNVVVSDEGFDGTVIRPLLRGVGATDSGTVRVGAGESWDALVDHAVARGWAGIEALSGIPGSVGAAPIQNIGAYGQELSDVLVAVDFLDYLTGEVSQLSAAELELGYRTSALKRGRRGVVLALELRLDPAGPGTVAYPQLARALGVELGSSVDLASIRAGVLELRRSKGMVLDPDDPDSVSCGSFFTNPIVSENFARGLPDDAPRWSLDDAGPTVVALGGTSPDPGYGEPTTVKLSAAWLIEHAGIRPGFALPGSRAAISSKHTLAIINRGDATAEQIAELARYIQVRVLAEFGVALQPEPVGLGLQL